MNEEKRREEIKDIIKEEAVEGAITCSVAHKIAKKKKTSVKKVGELIEEVNIKIKKCQLGCF